ncbi:MAG: hypothetical protein HQ573_07740 [Desulfobacteraceae bacterium]|nr:hypothetical protein [Desulfobacteraceae bacterium]
MIFAEASKPEKIPAPITGKPYQGITKQDPNFFFKLKEGLWVFCSYLVRNIAQTKGYSKTSNGVFSFNNKSGYTFCRCGLKSTQSLSAGLFLLISLNSLWRGIRILLKRWKVQLFSRCCQEIRIVSKRIIVQ